MTTLAPPLRGLLEHFEIGYDRAYIGTALHCRLCLDDDENRIADDVHDGPLADLVDTALRHLSTAHPYLPTAVATARARDAGATLEPANPARGYDVAVTPDGHRIPIPPAPTVAEYHARMQALRDEREDLRNPPGY